MNALDILGENHVNDQNDYTLGSGGPAANLYDQDPETVCESSGSSEGAAWTVLVEFNDRVGDAVARTIDRIILLGCNLSKFYFEYWSGSAWVTISESVHEAGTENADADIYIEMAAPVSTTKLRLTATNTIGAVAEKQVGELKACLFMAEIAARSSIERQDWDDGDSYRLQGGALVSFQNVQKVEADVKLIDLSVTIYNAIIDAIRDRAWMTWVLWNDFQPADVFEVLATSRPNEILDRKTALYSLDFKVKER